MDDSSGLASLSQNVHMAAIPGLGLGVGSRDRGNGVRFTKEKADPISTWVLRNLRIQRHVSEVLFQTSLKNKWIWLLLGSETEM